MRLEAEIDKIKKIKNEARRFEKLQELCVDEETLSDAIEIAKHESMSHLPIFTYAIALLAVLLNFIKDEFGRGLFLVIFSIGLVIITFEYKNWTIVYYDLIKIRRINKIKKTNAEVIASEDS